MSKKTVILGPEYDDATRGALRSALASLNATSEETSWGVGGSQEVETTEVLVGGSPLTVESETYIGLTITGEEEIVDTVVAIVREKMNDHVR